VAIATFVELVPAIALGVASGGVLRRRGRLPRPVG